MNYCKETGKWKHAPQWNRNLDNAACPAGSTFRHVVPRKREVSGSVGVTLRLTALVELELRAIRTIYARKDLRRAPFDIWLKSAFSWVHHTYEGTCVNLIPSYKTPRQILPLARTLTLFNTLAPLTAAALQVGVVSFILILAWSS